jgi:hypothetical protein
MRVVAVVVANFAIGTMKMAVTIKVVITRGAAAGLRTVTVTAISAVKHSLNKVPTEHSLEDPGNILGLSAWRVLNTTQ